VSTWCWTGGSRNTQKEHKWQQIVHCWPQNCRCQWPQGRRRRSTAARLLRLWVRISPGAWISVYCECCVLSGRRLCDKLITRPEESYWLWCVVCDLETPMNEEALVHWGLSRQNLTNRLWIKLYSVLYNQSVARNADNVTIIRFLFPSKGCVWRCARTVCQHITNICVQRNNRSPSSPNLYFSLKLAGLPATVFSRDLTSLAAEALLYSDIFKT